MPEKFKCKSKRIISIAEKQVGSDLFLIIDFLLNDTNTNLNGVRYSKEFLQEIVDNQEEYVGLPLKVDLNNLVSGNTENLTHNYSPITNKFYNQMIGSFVKFYSTKSDDDIYELAGQVRIPKEFKDACDIIQQLYEDEALFVSYEILVGKYTEENNGEIKFVDVDESNKLSGYSIVSTPAVVSAKATKLVAELLNIKESENEMVKKINPLEWEEKILAELKKSYRRTEIAELNYNQVMLSLRSQLKDNLGDCYWNFYIFSNGVDFLVMENYDDGSLVRIDFTVDGDNVVILNVYPVTIKYDSIENEEENEMAEKKKNPKKKLNDTKETDSDSKKDKADDEGDDEMSSAEIAAKLELEKVKRQDAEKKLEQANKKISTLSASVLEKDKKLKDMEELKAENETLKKDKAEKELAEKKIALKAKYEKILSEDTMKKSEVAEALEKGNEDTLQKIVVAEALASSENIERQPLGTRITDNASISDNYMVSFFGK
ncbi:hypothetical protein BJV85_002866 [Clostridium acetobutylicum]|uniref:Uncharacterized protein n=1 Tax=Clostridium acetobutylicum (strain ATCC 824 / DSM 792 / JCM 1419 / IAM 19013 / LMG 5710 / NBRC 13948 / NRRL B-527 / VKM B-1787 / 2291 / W) TaxID=272562 RepID=Q97JZ0_CLOAB|nr:MULTISPECIES: cell envelope integrity protein TolA [Clostridium]AAK79105.1 Hypothetical protein CA_C1132 [Clostridium acetobutylicum ATCC 824]ADZ20181.1 Conserved hypothetical protein [Clostridium acetobutylicum EA 2018]AEI31642.1 hypothetical protein SMB_G1151 [Clostridium acetobutylicum DSM 1731]AWV81641.1 hypothetical protein DK921_16395 [Clostridium acetobutylicum]MBC2393287.1 cell envelope integrity protein TolA [Clostridium acetobutylicum]